MFPLKYESFHSRNYELIVNSIHGYHFIQNRITGLSTLLSVGSEGLEDYQMLKAAWRKSRRLFDSLCADCSYE
ncbi:MAG: hypothetical protein R2867_02500 [Caldilineaceae bacterium]